MERLVRRVWDAAAFVLPFQGRGLCWKATQGGAARLLPLRSALGWFVAAFQAKDNGTNWRQQRPPRRQPPECQLGLDRLASSVSKSDVYSTFCNTTSLGPSGVTQMRSITKPRSGASEKNVNLYGTTSSKGTVPLWILSK
jgi:hypothetical protein